MQGKRRKTTHHIPNSLHLFPLSPEAAEDTGTLLFSLESYAFTSLEASMGCESAWTFNLGARTKREIRWRGIAALPGYTLLASSSSWMMGHPIFAGAIQSFGSSCEAFIEENNLMDILHSQLFELFNCTLPVKWHQEILGWFANYDKSTALALANGLYDAMYADAVTRSAQEQQWLYCLVL